MTTLIRILIAFAALSCGNVLAQEKVLTGVQPFAVHVYLEGVGEEQQNALANKVKDILIQKNVPMVEAKEFENEDSTFLLIQAFARLNEEPAGHVVLARFSIKQIMNHPVNGERVFMELGTCDSMWFCKDTDTVEKRLMQFMGDAVVSFSVVWHAQNGSDDPEKKVENEALKAASAASAASAQGAAPDDVKPEENDR